MRFICQCSPLTSSFSLLTYFIVLAVVLQSFDGSSLQGSNLLVHSWSLDSPPTMSTRSGPRKSRRRPVSTSLKAVPYASASTSTSASTSGPKTMTTTSLSKTTLSSVSLDSLSSLEYLPKLIVFDLDNTLWTPELYQIRQRQVPAVNKDIQLFEDAAAILQYLYQHQQQSTSTKTIQLAVASRTSKVDWAHALLDAFQVPTKSNNKETIPMRTVFDHIEIQPGSKKKHFANLRDMTGISYDEMLFIDDDERMNLGEVSQMGVLCVHTPRGITMEHFVKSVQKFHELKLDQQDADKPWMGYILNNQKLNIAEPDPVPAGRLCRGRIKFFSAQKKFGFVIDIETRQEFFFHESKVPLGMTLTTGDIVKFEATADGGGRPSAVILASDNTQGGDSAVSDGATTTMPCFTMSQPFASLLLNGQKTVESRNGPMFMDVKPGTKVLLHCGRRDWHDLESYKEILASEHDMSDEEINKAGRLPRGFAKGSIIGVVTVGKTWRSSDRERDGRDLQRRVLAPFDGIGKFCTEITDAKWLAKPYKTRGNAGVYDVSIPKDCLPSED